MLDLFAEDEPWQEPLAEGALILRRRARDIAPRLMAEIKDIAARNAFRHCITPGASYVGCDDQLRRPRLVQRLTRVSLPHAG